MIPALVFIVEQRFEPFLTSMIRAPDNHDVEKTVSIEICKPNVIKETDTHRYSTAHRYPYALISVTSAATGETG